MPKLLVLRLKTACDVTASGILSSHLWRKKITSRDECFLLIRGWPGYMTASKKGNTHREGVLVLSSEHFLRSTSTNALLRTSLESAELGALESNYQKPGDHPNFRRNALGVKRPFSELWESSRLFSEQLSEFRN